MSYVTIDFSNTVGIDPTAPIGWPPDLTQYYKDQPVDELRFAVSDGVLQPQVYLDRGLVLQYRYNKNNPENHLGVFLRKPDNIRVDMFGVIVDLDYFGVQESSSPVNPFIGSVGATGTSADASNGKLGPPHGIGPDNDDLNIGGTMAFNYDPLVGSQQTRLNSPATLFLDPPGNEKKPPFIPIDFFETNLPHPVQLANTSATLKMAASAEPEGIGALVYLDLGLSGAPHQSIPHIHSAKYLGNFDSLQYAGVTLNTSNDRDPFTLGPIMVRINKIRLYFVQMF